MDYYAKKWEIWPIFDELSEKSPFSKELHASRLSSMPTCQATSGAGRLEKKSQCMQHNSGLLTPDGSVFGICLN